MIIFVLTMLAAGEIYLFMVIRAISKFNVEMIKKLTELIDEL